MARSCQYGTTVLAFGLLVFDAVSEGTSVVTVTAAKSGYNSASRVIVITAAVDIVPPTVLISAQSSILGDKNSDSALDGSISLTFSEHMKKQMRIEVDYVRIVTSILFKKYL